MPLPVIKTFFVLTKIFLKPFVSFMKKELSRSYHPHMERFLHFVGENVMKFSHYYNTIIYTKAYNIDQKISQIKVRPQKIEYSQAVEKGTEIVFEWIFIYGTIIGISMYEIKKNFASNRETARKIGLLQSQVKELQAISKELNVSLDGIHQKLDGSSNSVHVSQAGHNNVPSYPQHFKI